MSGCSHGCAPDEWGAVLVSCLHLYVCVPCVRPWACVRACVCSGAIPVSLCICVPVFSVCAPGSSMYYISVLRTFLLSLGGGVCLYLACVCVTLGVPMRVAGFYGHPCVAGAPACPTIPAGGVVSGSPLHTLPCVCGPCAFVRVCSPCAFQVCVHLGSCVCPFAPPCPLRGARELRPGAPWASPLVSRCAWREASGRTRPRLDPPPGTARGGGRGRRRRGARARHRDRQAGGREAAAAGSSRRRSPAAPSPCPRPGEPPPSPGAAKMQFPVQAPRLGGLFREGFG